MNLMFWKKKTTAKNSAKIPPQDTDDKAAGEKSSDRESADSETTKKTGLFARLKSRFTKSSKKSPVPDSEENKGATEDSHRRTKPEAEDRADIDADSETSKKPGLFARIKARLAALTERSRKAPDAEEAAADEHRPAKHEAEEAAEHAEAIEPKHSKKGWIIGGVALLLILLAAGGYFALDYLLPPLKRSNVAHEKVMAYRNRQQADPQQTEPPQAEVPQPAPPQAESEVPKNEPQQPPVQPVQPSPPAAPPAPSAPSAPPAQQPVGNALPTSGKGGVEVGSGNPKSTAMSMKEAIKAMNAASGESPRKPAQ